MKPISQMTQLELAAYVHDHLRQQGIDVVLSGGSVVSFYSHNLYVSKDVDLINIAFTKRSKLRRAMEALGFVEQGRHFLHPETPHIVEFPDGPLAVGEEPVREIREIVFETGVLRVLSATDCVKDRLCAFYFWEDRQGLEQAVLVSQQNPVDLDEIKRWSQVEGKLGQFASFKQMVSINK
jgi:hypothetical protein